MKKDSVTKFTEATRVQMPALVHLTRMGYTYFGKIYEDMAGIVYDPDTNILTEVFKKQFKKLNPEREGEADEVLRAIRQELDYDDLGRAFYNRLTRVSSLRLIDYDNYDNNTFHFTGEFTCKRGLDEFRPDITLFINGLPLVFIEVKKPNNKGGIVEEIQRMNSKRFPNKKFRRFINITQFMIFSNNMEYDSLSGIVPVQGAFYCAAARESGTFNCFREENLGNESVAPFIADYPYASIDQETERRILTDFNCQVIHHAPEYQTNLNVNTPTNRILTSMCSPERLLFMIKYGFAYVKMEKEVDGKIESTDQKHIMRYQQLFATYAIKRCLSEGIKSGVVWHTQGSGKTALSYYLMRVLSDFYAKQKKVAKFYFIVDRLDLLEQATQEFEARGLEVKTADTREELMAQFRTTQAQEGTSGKNEVTVVNIQRFAQDNKKMSLNAYATNLQRVFIIDEAHRGYDPAGSFLANLFEADQDSIKIALTGTPLLKAERSSWKVFGTYLHTYYYDKSIQDGYTLKIIREDIEISYKDNLSLIYEQLEHLVRKRDLQKSQIVEHDTYIKELLRYIISDLTRFRVLQNDKSLGGMIICETSEQARKIFVFFDEIQSELNQNASMPMNLRAGLILYDSDDKETRKQIIKDFKKNMTIDILIVYNMLLTGFDAPRLKRLYFGRKLKDHNLLQAITRVNRPYKSNRYGYIIDFADIKKNFDETNEAYLKELNRFSNPNEVGEDTKADTLLNVIEDKGVLIQQIQEIQQTLFNYTTDNLEIFSQEISQIEDRQRLDELKKALITAKDCYNIVRTFGDKELKEEFAKIEIHMLSAMISEIQSHLEMLTQKEVFSQDDVTRQLVNEAMANITFTFSKIGQEEMQLISGGVELQEKWEYTIRSFLENTDQEDEEYVTLRNAFVERFKECGFVVDNIAKYNEQMKALDEIIKKLSEIQRKNKALARKYNGDFKYACVHKRIREENERRRLQNRKEILSTYDEKIREMLMNIKTDIDQKVYDRNDILKKDAYFEQTVMVQIKEQMDKLGFEGTREDRVFVQSRITAQYLAQYNATYSGFISANSLQ